MDPQHKPQDDNQLDRDAAEKVVRDQLESIYRGHSSVATPAGTNAHQHRPQHHENQHDPQAHQQHATLTDDTARYHNEWQEYYRQYYERYYVGQLHQALKDKERQPNEQPDAKESADISTLRKNVRSKAGKVRKSRHFIPVMSAFVVVLVVMFLQYNQIIIANVEAYVSPGSIDPQNIVVDPNSDLHVSAAPRLIIPKINVDVPVIYDVGYDHDAQMAAMEKGVAHFAIPGANSVPGQVGNTVFSGHSSNDLFDPGDYKFIFAQLNKLQQGDTIYVNYNSIRYTYTVTKTEVVKPTDVQSLYGLDDKPYLTLITCTPLGTALNRLLVKAEQVAPDPSKAMAENAQTANSGAAIPGNGPSALERLFGAH
jgi:sortase A